MKTWEKYAKSRDYTYEVPHCILDIDEREEYAPDCPESDTCDNCPYHSNYVPAGPPYRPNNEPCEILPNGEVYWFM